VAARAWTNTAESLGIEIRRVPSALGGEGIDRHGGGALVELKGREILFLDPDAPVADRIAVAAGALAGRSELEATYLPPEIRQLIEGA
jgi:hypothetical protein